MTPAPEDASDSEPAPDSAAERWTDRVLEVEVGPVAHGGHCVARTPDTEHSGGHADRGAEASGAGRVVFVRHALPGELVRAVVTEDGGGSFCRADAVAILRPSPDRVEAPCVWAGPGGCGGCDFQHADPGAQRTLKAAVVTEQLQRLAGIRREVVCEPLPDGPLRWRTRMRMGVTDDGRPGLRAHRSHEVLPVGDCPIAAEGALVPVLEREWAPGIELEIVRDADGAVHVAELDGRHRRPVHGTHTAREHAAGRDWDLPAEAFWQVHPRAADAVVDAVLEGVGELGAGALAWDLYGGAGLIAAPLAERVGPGGRVVLVESDPAAATAAGENLADLPTVQVVRARVERVLAHLDGVPDVIVADPPRRGLGRELAAEIAAKGAARIVHVACDPAALARDLAAFEATGYALVGLRVLDAFPMTHHMECVAVLARPERHG